MKPPPSRPIPDPASSRGRRGLTEEERALWESVAKQIKPLRKKTRVARQTAVPAPEASTQKAAATPRPIAQVQAPKPSKPAAPPLARASR